MDRMWAPWRKTYIRPSRPEPKGCLFCRLPAEKKDKKNYILKRTPLNFAILNLYPYNNGHLMIVPNRHVAAPAALSAEEKIDWLNLADEMMAALKTTIKPHGFNMGINLGRIAGAGVPGHVHLHIVPRWKGDVNFMPVTASAKIISESLDSVYASLAGVLKK